MNALTLTAASQEKLVETLAPIGASIRDFEKALAGINDPEWPDRFASSLELGRKIIAAHEEKIRLDLANDFSGLRSQIARHNVPRESDEHGLSERLRAIRSARGSLLADIDELLLLAGEYGIVARRLDEVLPDSQVLEKAGFENMLRTLDERMRRVEDGVAKIAEASDADADASPQQKGLVNFFVDNVSIDIALARAEVTASELVDFNAMASAIEGMIVSTGDFVASVKGMPKVISQQVTDAAIWAKTRVIRAGKGFRTIIRSAAKSVLHSPAQKDPTKTIGEAGTDTAKPSVDDADAHATKEQLAELREQIRKLSENLAQSKPSEAGPFVEAATKLLDSGDPLDVERVREILAGRSEEVAENIMADAEASAIKNAERYRQAASISASSSPSKAKAAYEAAVALDPSDVRSWIELGRLRADYDGIESAELAFKNALQQVPLEMDRIALHTELGNLQIKRGNLVAALSEYQQAADIGERLIAKDDTSTELQGTLSLAYKGLGELEYMAGNLGVARQHYEEALTILEALAKEAPDSPQWQHDLSISYYKLGDVEVAAGDLATARTRFEESLKIRERLAAAGVGNAQWQRYLSVSYNKLGDVEVKAGNLTMARTRFEEAFKITKKLAVAEPGNAEWQRDLSVSYGKLGEVEVKAGNLAMARTRFEEAFKITEKLAAAETGNAEWQRDVWVSYWRMAQLKHPDYPWSRVLAKIELMNEAGTLFPNDREFLDRARKLANTDDETAS